MLEYDWEDSVGAWLCMTSHELRKAMGPFLQEVGLTLRQWEVLACLSHRGQCAQTELAEALSIEANTLAGVIKRMCLAGLLERRSCPKDRRRKLLSPTAKAEELWSKAAAASHQVRNIAVAGLSDRDLATLKSCCEQMRTNLAQLRNSATTDEA